MNLSDFIEKQETILLDGAMATELEKFGLEMGGQNNLTNPEKVLDIHRRYANCGCNILITNTLTMNRIYVESHSISVNVREVNMTGARLARQAAGKDLYVLGDISSTGKLLEPYGECSELEFYETFKEQVQFLAEGGVDGFIIETMLDLRESLCALRACRDVSDLPVIASMSFASTDNRGRTIMGNSTEECARELTMAGAQAIGANCGALDPYQTAEIVSFLREATNLPVLAQPNAGKPKLIDGRTVFDMLPTDFADGIAECLLSGAHLLGGCCGTSPEHIQAVAAMLKKKKQK